MSLDTGKSIWYNKSGFDGPEAYLEGMKTDIQYI